METLMSIAIRNHQEGVETPTPELDPISKWREAYWLSQPPALRIFPTLNSDKERAAAAQSLADQGYIIDVPIMMWGWDPFSTNVVRYNQGYRWVPSANMEPVKVAPGVNMPGLPPYDPSSPPAGAILIQQEPNVNILPKPYRDPNAPAATPQPFQKYNRKWAQDGTPDGVGSLWGPNPDDASPVGTYWPPQVGAGERQWLKFNSGTSAGYEQLWKRVA